MQLSIYDTYTNAEARPSQQGHQPLTLACTYSV